MLDKANIYPPCILVGHSFGGLNMQLFAEAHAEEVAGLLLVDSVHPEHYAKMPVELREAVNSQLSMLRIGNWLGPSGVPPILFPPVTTQGLPQRFN